MKNTKVCTKCNSDNIAIVNDMRSRQMVSIKTGTITVAPITRYVCCDCGYVEQWITELKDLRKIKNLYK